ncbi:DNA-binding response regulator [Romboutsia maritimum]|uniref:Stage 0 sporulation protein A homolog n=1 Tax=Romboutsia maritimum TaxID=2020948 RepID=A0A371IQP1_9FIRM|nr:response regulator transcription factor [Romboutsia maritimum]RDY22807.1 DNA-binding response regulator [Romboutsia maritimum]
MNILIVSESFIIRDALEEIFKVQLENENTKVIKMLHSQSEVDNIDFIFVDIRNDVVNQIKIVESIKKTSPEKKIIVLDSRKRGSVFKKAIKIGVEGYVVDILDRDEFIYIVKKVMSGKKSYEFDLIQDMLNHEEKHKKYDLTRREEEVLNLAGEGFNNREIGKKLYITECTVKKHISNIFMKLNLKNRKDIISYAKYNYINK